MALGFMVTMAQHIAKGLSFTESTRESHEEWHYDEF
jgi:hypothetical protein